MLRLWWMGFAVVGVFAAAHVLGAEEPDEGEKVVRAYMAEVAATICIAEPKEPPERSDLMAKLDKIGQERLLKFKDALHKKAVRDYLKLEVWKPEAGVKMREIFGDDARVKDVVSLYVKSHFGKPPFDSHSFAATWWDPQAPAKFIREMAFLQCIGDDLVEKRKFMETLTPPRYYRMNDDAEKPVVAIYDGRELTVAHLSYFEGGVYEITGFEWFTFQRPETAPEPSKTK